MRQDVAEARADIGSIIGSVESVVTKLDQPIQVTLERTRQGGVRDLFRPTDVRPRTAARLRPPPPPGETTVGSSAHGRSLPMAEVWP